MGATWQLGSATVRLLGPVAQYDDTNDTSLVLRIDYRARRWMWTCCRWATTAARPAPATSF